MGIRTDPANENLHYLDCRPDGYKGKRVRVTYEGSREAAEDYYRALMQRTMSKPLPTARTLKALWPEYREWCRANRAGSTVTDIQSCWERHLLDYFGGLQPKMLTRALVERYKQKRLGEARWGGAKGGGTASPRTITKELHYLSGMIAWAVKMDYCAPLGFAIEGFATKRTRAPKARPLSADQVEAILTRLAPRLRLPFLLMADAGLRASEALTLCKRQVDMARGLLYVVGKGGKERIVPIATGRLRAALLPALAGGCEYLVVNARTGRPYGSIKKPLETAARRAGIDQHVYQHLLRHTFGTLATVSGVAQAALQNIMGHSSPVTTGIYQQLAAEQLREQAAQFGAMIDRSARPHGQAGHPDNWKE